MGLKELYFFVVWPFKKTQWLHPGIRMTSFEEKSAPYFG
jgi:hypothetical protein